MNQHWQWWVQVTCCSEKGGACKYAILTGTCSPSRNNHHVCLQLLRWSLAALQGKRFTGLWVGRGLRTGSSVMQGEQLLEPFPPVATRAVAGLRGRRKNLHAAQAATGDQLSSPFPCLWGACPLLNWWGPSPVQKDKTAPPYWHPWPCSSTFFLSPVLPVRTGSGRRRSTEMQKENHIFWRGGVGGRHE